MIYLNKLLPIFVSPIGIVSALIILGLLLRKNRYFIVSLTLFWLFSLPIVSNSLLGYLEKDYSIRSTSEMPRHEAVVVLGGMVRQIEQRLDIHNEFTDAVDRILAGIEIVKEGKANRLILTRGSLPWSKGKPEGEFLFGFANKYGVPLNSISITPIVQNTDDEAKAVFSMLNSDKPIILVTSAFHMPRARKVFEGQKIKVTPFPVDFRQVAKQIDVLDFMPQARAFQETSLFSREIIGRLYYDIKYRIFKPYS